MTLFHKFRREVTARTLALGTELLRIAAAAKM
jgi:hypothetical protein